MMKEESKKLDFEEAANLLDWVKQLRRRWWAAADKGSGLTSPEAIPCPGLHGGSHR